MIDITAEEYAELPSLSILKDMFLYYPEIGSLRRAKDANHNARRGDEAGTVSNGYRQVSIRGRIYRTHRIVWKMHYGEDPNGRIDHIDGDGLNNRIENLRVVCAEGNSKNCKKRTDNTSGTVGVNKRKDVDKWRAYIYHNKKRKHLGNFDTKEEAISARKSAELKYGYHENHGR